MPRIVTLLALLLVAVGIVYPVLLVPQGSSWTGYIPAILGGLMLLLGLWKAGAARWVTLLLALAGAGAATSRLVKAEKLDLGASYPQQALALTVLLCGVIVIACLVGKRAAPGTPPAA